MDKVNTTEGHSQSDEITLKELILKFTEFFWEVVRNWMLIGLLIFGFLCYLMYDVYTTPVTYTAQLKFMLNDDGGGADGMSLVLGSLGLGGMRKGKGLTGMEKILQLFKTRTVIDRSLITPAEVGNLIKPLANHIIDTYGFQDLLDSYGSTAWKRKLEGLENYQFSDTLDVDNLDEQQQILMKILYDNVVGNSARGILPMMVSTYSEDAEIMTLTVTTKTEDLTIGLINRIYEELSGFFIDKAIEKQQKTFDILTEKNDSIQTALRGAEYSLADFKDSHRKLMTVKGTLKRTALERKVRLLTIMYGESVKNLEVADFSLRRRKPYVQIIDAPMRPLSPRVKSQKNAIIYSILIGGVLGSMFVIARKIVRDALVE